jgi:glutamyl-tRNA synthetase
MVRVRFAPSPTGYLHVGGARTALFNWLFARRQGGICVLRIEDTDEARNTEAAYRAIYDGLRWLGLDWDEGPDANLPAAERANRGAHGPYFQSQRKEIYDRYFAQLEASGHLYTEENGAARFRSPRLPITMHDQVCGEITIDRSEEPDMTIRRPDGSYIFHFVNVVDDIEMRITHVIRGEDHLMNTPKHLELFAALGVAPPIYGHIPLILNPDGSKMSKRDQGAAIDSYISEGFSPAAVRNFFCLLGWSPKDDRQKVSIEDVIALFDWDHLNRSPAKFDHAKCHWLNAQYLADYDAAGFAAFAQAWLATDSVPARHTASLAPAGDVLPAALELVRPKVKHLPELADHFAMLFHDAAPLDAEAQAKVAAKAETQALLARLITDLTAASDWSADGIKAAVETSAKAQGVKPGALLFPLRVLATGQSHGADLMPALALIGKESVLGRLTARLSLIFSAAGSA